MSIPIRNLSLMAFQDYYRLRKQADLQGKQLYDTVRQHDKDKITYGDMYETLRLLDDTALGRMNSLFNISVDTVGGLLSLLVQRNVISKEEADNLVKTILKMYDEDKKEKDKNEQ